MPKYPWMNDLNAIKARLIEIKNVHCANVSASAMRNSRVSEYRSLYNHITNSPGITWDQLLALSGLKEEFPWKDDLDEITKRVIQLHRLGVDVSREAMKNSPNLEHRALFNNVNSSVLSISPVKNK